ncbi:MAG: UbiA family prenyltransferase [Candidatus Methanofastidiosa archaeon]|nr:UbiA family prenyltransferase [Candidatus Methanofastidiosa archaeon]
MKFRAIVYNSATLNAPKNILQFLFGVVIYTSLTGDYDILKILGAASGLSMGLGAIYLFNDLTDYEEDRKNQMKISWKAIANGSVSVQTAKYLIIILSILGTLFSFLSGTNFFVIFVAIIALNLLYSYPAIRLKSHKNSSLIVITLIQILKFSSGWFLFTNSLEGFPSPFVISLSVGYALLFLYYKNNTTNAKTIIRENKKRVYPLSLVMFLFLLISFFMYAFPVVFLLILGMSVPTILFYTLSKDYLGTKVNFAFMYAGLIIILLSFLLLSVPTVTATNDTILGYSNQIKEILKHAYLNR